MVTSRKRRPRKQAKQSSVKSIKVEFADEPVTSFGGLALTERLAQRLGLWQALSGSLPKRGGRFSWLDVIKPAVAGFLSGSRGTAVCEEVRSDAALRRLLGIDGVPEEATFWRDLDRLGDDSLGKVLARAQRLWTRRTLESSSRNDLLTHGFFPLFGDGSLLEGSVRREGTKTIRDKGKGLMWSGWFAGPLLASHDLAGPKQGEASCLRAQLPEVLSEVIDPLGLRSKALVLMDSLHGDGPTLDQFEAAGLKYVVGANKLKQTATTLGERSESEWIEQGPVRGWAESAVCVCWLQCEQWPAKRALIGRRWRKDGDLPGMYEYSGVLTALTEADVAHIETPDWRTAIWRLYDLKGGWEDRLKDLLEDLSGHHPPCQSLQRNRGYYALLGLTHTLGRAVDLIGNKSPERGSTKRQDGRPRKRAKPRRMRLWRLRRRLLSLPGRIATHARTVKITLLDVGARVRAEFEACLRRLSRC